ISSRSAGSTTTPDSSAASRAAASRAVSSGSTLPPSPTMLPATRPRFFSPSRTYDDLCSPRRTRKHRHISGEDTPVILAGQHNVRVTDDEYTAQGDHPPTSEL